MKKEELIKSFGEIDDTLLRDHLARKEQLRQNRDKNSGRKEAKIMRITAYISAAAAIAVIGISSLRGGFQRHPAILPAEPSGTSAAGIETSEAEEAVGTEQPVSVADFSELFILLQDGLYAGMSAEAADELLVKNAGASLLFTIPDNPEEQLATIKHEVYYACLDQSGSSYSLKLEFEPAHNSWESLLKKAVPEASIPADWILRSITVVFPEETDYLSVAELVTDSCRERQKSFVMTKGSGTGNILTNVIVPADEVSRLDEAVLSDTPLTWRLFANEILMDRETCEQFRLAYARLIEDMRASAISSSRPLKRQRPAAWSRRATWSRLL